MIYYRSSCLLLAVFVYIFNLSASSHDTTGQIPLDDSILHDVLSSKELLYNDPLYYDDPLPLATREKWMRVANGPTVLHTHTPCPFMAFGTAIVNHTLSFLDPFYPGELICTGLNHNNHTSNPILDGEISAIENCSRILTDPNGPYKLSVQEAIEAYTELTVYTNGEPCPMCASAIIWTGFKEMVFGSSIATLVGMGWPQIRVNSRQIFEASWDTRRTRTAWVGSVLSEETDKVYEWQFQQDVACPKGCKRKETGGRCWAD